MFLLLKKTLIFLVIKKKIQKSFSTLNGMYVVFKMNNDFYKKFVKCNDKYLDSFVRYKDKPNFMNPRLILLFFKIDQIEIQQKVMGSEIRKKSINIFDIDNCKSFLNFFDSTKLYLLFLANMSKSKALDYFKNSYRDILNISGVPFEENKIAIVLKRNDTIKSFNMCLCPKGFFIYQDLQGVNVRLGTINYGHTMKIKMTHDFWVSETKITQEIWQEIMEYNPSYFNGHGKEDMTIEYSEGRTSPRINSLTYTKPNEYGIDLQRPVDSISWYDSIEFCNRLSLLSGLNPCYRFEIKEGNPDHPMVHWDINANGFRLLTDVEWDYVSKAISSDSKIKEKDVKIYWNEQRYNDFREQTWTQTWDESQRTKRMVEKQMHDENPNIKTYKGNTSLLEKYVYNFDSVRFLENIPKVAIKKPNAFGLYDMHGYSADWVFDSANTLKGYQTASKNKALIFWDKERIEKEKNKKYVMSNIDAYIGQEETKPDIYSYAKGFSLEHLMPDSYIGQPDVIYLDNTYDKKRVDKFIGLRIAKNKD